MQLLHEIRREYQREHSTYLLSVAVAAPSAFVDMCYDVRMINDNVDFVNLMTYDFHFYSKSTPYVGEYGNPIGIKIYQLIKKMDNECNVRQ